MRIFAAIFICATLLTGGCGDSNSYERSENLMGTIVTLKAEGNSARTAIDESFDAIFALVDKIKVDVDNLNNCAGNGEFIGISPEVFEMLTISQKYSELTGGAFDITVGAAVDLWRNARRTETLPTAEEIAAVKNLVGYQHLHLNEPDHSAMLDTPGVKINLGGIGKGYGVDIVRKIFIEHGINDGIIDFGTSSIFVFGNKRIGLRNPRADNDLAEVIEIKNAALSTSGDYEQFFIVDGHRYHHIINPTTCMPTDNGVISVSVAVNDDIANCATIADILSTSIFVLGSEHGNRIATSIDDTISVRVFSAKQ